MLFTVLAIAQIVALLSVMAVVPAGTTYGRKDDTLVHKFSRRERRAYRKSVQF